MKTQAAYFNVMSYSCIEALADSTFVFEANTFIIVLKASHNLPKMHYTYTKLCGSYSKYGETLIVHDSAYVWWKSRLRVYLFADFAKITTKPNSDTSASKVSHVMFRHQDNASCFCC